jgi:hypothetical protein
VITAIELPVCAVTGKLAAVVMVITQTNPIVVQTSVASTRVALIQSGGCLIPLS